MTEFPEDWDVPAPDDTEAKSGYDMLIEMIKSMPASVGRVLELRLIQEYNFKEIGKVLGCSEDAAQKRCSRATKELEKRMGAE